MDEKNRLLTVRMKCFRKDTCTGERKTGTVQIVNSAEVGRKKEKQQIVSVCVQEREREKEKERECNN